MLPFFFNILQDIAETTEIFSSLFIRYKHGNEPDLSDIKLPTWYRPDPTKDIQVNLTDEQIIEMEYRYMIFELCNGHISNKNWVSENCNDTDFAEFMCFRKYNNYREAEYSKRIQKNG